MPDLYELGLLFKDMDDFDLGCFEGRLRFQNTVQILQSFGIDLGYRFHWYPRGPYSATLTKDGFDLRDAIHRIPKLPMDFERKEDGERYSDFKEFMRDKKDDPDQLKIASSICFLHGIGKKEVLDLIKEMRKYSMMEEYERMWDELARYRVVGS